MSDPIKATVEVVDGAPTVRTSCRECGMLLWLPCRFENGTLFDPRELSEPWQRFALQWADLVICSRCDTVREESRREAEAAQGLAQRVKAAGIPETFRGLEFDDMDSGGGRGKAISAAWAWADTPPDAAAGVLLHGPQGTGKSRLAATAVWRRLQRFPVAWCSVAHLIASLQASFSDNDRKEALRVLTGAGALVLDDLDKVKASETVLSQLFVAIDRRVSAGAPLFVTSNSAPGLLEERFGAPVTSRLMGYCQVFEFAGRDRRTQLAVSGAMQERGDE